MNMLNLKTHKINTRRFAGTMPGSPVELYGDKTVKKGEWGPCLLSQRISWEQNKGGKNALKNKAVSRSWGLSSDIALWLLIAAWSTSWLENTHWSLLQSVLLTANPLKSIYGLSDITYSTCAHCLVQLLGINWRWHTGSEQSPSSNICLHRVLEMKFNFWKVGQQYKLDHTGCAFGLISRGLRAPCWRSKLSPATHHVSTSRHREAPLALVTAVF